MDVGGANDLDKGDAGGQKDDLGTHNALAVSGSYRFRTAHTISVRHIIEQLMSSLVHSFPSVLRALAATDAGSCAVGIAVLLGDPHSMDSEGRVRVPGTCVRWQWQDRGTPRDQLRG